MKCESQYAESLLHKESRVTNFTADDQRDKGFAQSLSLISDQRSHATTVRFECSPASDKCKIHCLKSRMKAQANARRVNLSQQSDSVFQQHVFEPLTTMGIECV